MRSVSLLKTHLSENFPFTQLWSAIFIVLEEMRTFFLFFLKNKKLGSLGSKLFTYEIFPFKFDFTAPSGVIKGVPLYVARPSSLTKKSSATFP